MNRRTFLTLLAAVPLFGKLALPDPGEPVSVDDVTWPIANNFKSRLWTIWELGK